MRAIRIAILCMAAMTAACSEPVRYTIAPGPDTALELKVDKTGLLRGKRHSIVFEQFAGEVEYDPRNPARSSVRLRIRSGSAVCRDTWLGAKDLQKVERYARHDMLASETHPEIRFESTAVAETAPGQFEIHGVLTIRGIAKPSVVRVESQTEGGGNLAFRGTAIVRLTDYGLKPPTAALGTIGTKNEMELMIRAAIRRSGESDLLSRGLRPQMARLAIGPRVVADAINLAPQRARH